jgi:hypothetical protein
MVRVAVAGFILNANSREYVGVSDILKRYQINLTLAKLMACDTLFFCLLGPVLMVGIYEPKAVAQAITLGLGWPFVIRGIINRAQGGQAQPDVDDPTGGAADAQLSTRHADPVNPK